MMARIASDTNAVLVQLGEGHGYDRLGDRGGFTDMRLFRAMHVWRNDRGI